MDSSHARSRRDFLAGSVAAGVGVCLSIRGIAFGGPMAAPDPSPPTSAPAGTPPIDCGPVDEIKEGVTDKWAQNKKILIVRKEGEITAMTAVCLHEKGILKAGTDGTIWCTKHAPGHYDGTGKPLAGPPAKRNAGQQLPRYGVSIKDGHLWVDKTKAFKQGEFDQAGAFLKLPK